MSHSFLTQEQNLTSNDLIRYFAIRNVQNRFLYNFISYEKHDGLHQQVSS